MSAQNIVPVHVPYTAGEPYDFGTHANDFLLRRENALATETFTVRVPGGGAVPEHVHTDMEQTFVFISGVGEAALRRGGDVRTVICRGGDTLFVPTGWHHTVAAPGPEGCTYLTVNAFVAGTARIGDSALAHAGIAAENFPAPDGGAAVAGGFPGPAALLRCAEAAFAPGTGGAGLWPADFTQFGATLTRVPDSYRVRRVGPFEYVTPVTPVARVLDVALADRLHEAVDGLLPVYVEGSQSPLSVKQPCASSDLDVLIAVATTDDLEAAGKALDVLSGIEGVPVPLSPSVVCAEWLGLPNFYSACRLDPASPDRQWWDADPDARGREAARRQREGLRLLRDAPAVAKLMERSLAILGSAPSPHVEEWRLTPRWWSLV